MADQADEADEIRQTGQGKQAAVPEAPVEDERYRGATPPGYDWPTHGGYLGCLLAVMAACLVAPLGYILFGFLGAFLARPLGGFGVALAVIVTVGVYLAFFVGLTRLGWALGKRFLREYAQPVRPVWGEDDEEEATLYGQIVDADPDSATSAPRAAQDAESDEASDVTPAERPT